MNKNPHLEKIIDFYHSHKRMPSYREIMNLIGFKSKNAAFKLVSKLIDYGYLQKDKTGRLIPGKAFREISLLGVVEAGFPSPAEEETSDTLSLDDWLIKNKEATYILKVQGDSMKDAGIMEGDMVLVERTADAKDGQIVIALVDNEWTLKYLRKKRDKVYLEPANKKYKPIFPKESLKIEAVVKAVIRKY